MTSISCLSFGDFSECPRAYLLRRPTLATLSFVYRRRNSASPTASRQLKKFACWSNLSLMKISLVAVRRRSNFMYYAQATQNSKQWSYRNGTIFEFTKASNSRSAGTAIYTASAMPISSRIRNALFKRLVRNHSTRKTHSQPNDDCIPAQSLLQSTIKM